MHLVHQNLITLRYSDTQPRHIGGDAFIKELTKYESKSGEKVKSAAIKKLIDMVHSGVLDEETAQQIIRQVVQLGKIIMIEFLFFIICFCSDFWSNARSSLVT